MLQPLWKTVWRFLKNLKIVLPYDPAIALLGIYLKKKKNINSERNRQPMLITALFMVANLWKQPKYPSTEEWVKMMIMI